MLTIYSKAQCPYCDQAKSLLELKGIKYEEVKIDEVPEAREFVLAEGHRTVPQIYKGNKLFVSGGFQGLSNLTESELYEKLND